LKPTMVNPLEQGTSTCCTHVRQLAKYLLQWVAVRNEDLEITINYIHIVQILERQ
jgi:hypothetical protein